MQRFDVFAFTELLNLQQENPNVELTLVLKESLNKSLIF